MAGCKIKNQRQLERAYALRHAVGWVCPHCKLARDETGCDPCIGRLPGVKNACCGHGKKGGYIAFENGIVVRFDSLSEVEYNAPGIIQTFIHPSTRIKSLRVSGRRKNHTKEG
jgi:ribosomal protein S18